MMVLMSFLSFQGQVAGKSVADDQVGGHIGRLNGGYQSDFLSISWELSIEKNSEKHSARWRDDCW